MSDHSPSRLSLTGRAVAAGVDVFGRLGYGVSAPFNQDYIRTYGTIEYLRWLTEAFRITRRLEQRYGPVEGQMIIAMAGLWTGCRWCSIAHMYIANLVLYHREKTLGPIDELEMPRWQDLRDSEILVLLERRLTGRWSTIGEVGRRMYALRIDDVTPESDDDFLLVRTNAMWEWIIECTIMAFDFDPESIPAWGYPARSRKLQARYRAARRASNEVPEE